MQLNLCPLFSGSSGNSVYMACGGVKLLVDAGMSAARVEANLREIGVDIRNIDAILITHEHIDHVRGLGVLCRRYGMPVYANEGTWQGILQKETGIPQKCMRTFYTGEDFYIGALNVHPFPIPHDAADPVGFAFDCQGLRCGVATDIGHISETWMRAVSGCQALVLEANHDVDMVRRGPYPQRLKQRILGPLGHLSNDAAAAFAAQMARLGTREIVLAHLSRENNTPAMALERVGRALSGTGVRLSAAPRRELGGPYIVEVSNAKGQHPLCGETEGEVLPRCSGGIQ